MTISIILKDAEFVYKTPLFDIPNGGNCRVFSLLGGTLDRSLANHGSGSDGQVVGSVSIEDDGVIITQLNAIRFSGIDPLAGGVTMMAAFKTLGDFANSGVINAWSAASMSGDSLSRRIYLQAASYRSLPGAIDSDSLRPVAANSPYLLSLSRHSSGAASKLRLHDATGAVVLESPLSTYAGAELPWASDAVLDVGSGSSALSTGVLMKGAACWMGIMSDADIVSAAALMAEVTGVFE